MAILVSPGVSVTVTDESQYGSAGNGTVPLLIIATAQDKFQSGSTTATALGTLKANAGKLFLITSQRDALVTFGSPNFVSTAGSIQLDSELNELGLFTLYEYLGIANTAYVIRADIDLAELVPSSVEPSGPVVSGQYWLDLGTTSWGLFRSNGNPNPAFSWQNQNPLVINQNSNLETIVQGYAATPIVSSSSALITSSGILVINGVSVSLAAGDSLSTVASKINSNALVQLKKIGAKIFARQGKFSPTQTTNGDIYNLRLVTPVPEITITITLTGSSTSILNDLGLVTEPENIILPASTYGNGGNFAVNTLASADGMMRNEIWEKITVTTSSGQADWWFKVGSTDSTYPGWGWKQAVPKILTGTVNNATFNPGDTCTIQIDDNSPLTITVPASPNNNLTGLVNAINAQLNSGSGTNAVAKVLSNGGNKYLQLINYDGTDITINDVSDQYGVGHPWRDAGILPINTYWASVTGSVSNPTFQAATLLTQSAVPSSNGSGYAVGDNLTVSGGTHTISTVLTVASICIVGAAPNVAGSNYKVNDTITFSGVGYDVNVILTVDSIDINGGITGLSITQAGQFTGNSAPTTGVSPNSTSGTGVGTTVNLTWGVNTVTVGIPGSYSVYPTNPVSTTGGTGSSATFNLTSNWLQSTSFSIGLPGITPVIVHVPASPNNTLDGVIDEINNVGFPNGPIVASKSAFNQLILTNSNGTSFTVEDIRGTPLNGAGIAAGVFFGRKLLYQGYQPSLTVPSLVADTAQNNIWINTTPGGLGVALTVKRYVGSAWILQNTSPNTGTIPMYDSDLAADAGFGSLKAYGSIYGLYNSMGSDPEEADVLLRVWNGTAWVSLDYVASATAPTGPAVDGTIWYNSSLRVDIMVNDGLAWVGYKNMYPGTDPNGAILDSAEPVKQSTGGALVDYDIWIKTDEPVYPTIYRYNATSAQWTLIDNMDHGTSAGIIFADARPNADGTKTGSTLTSDMVTSDYIDPDAPDALLHPAGMLLFNTRYSTYNVKVFRSNYLPAGNSWRDRWVTFSGNAPDGTPYMGPNAQRICVVNALNGALVSSTDARAEQNFFNLIATPGYTECLAEMVALNTDKNNVAFVIGDTPRDLPATGTAIQNWANNSADVAIDNSQGLITHSPYAGLWYPWGLASDLSGNEVLVPSSFIALRTIAYNDSVAYPWFPPAGFNRGLVTGVNSVGYLDQYGDYIPVTLNQGQRDVLYQNNINPIAYIPGRGLVVYGQKTLDPITSALDRVNVSRLINYLVYNLDNLAKPFLFELNDSTTRENVSATFNAYLQNLVTLRALYDFAVVCDDSNNTPVRIDQNQLWIDVAIKPEKAIEFIYIPIRVLNTGAPMPGGTR
jgi:Phage tail sheath C-terminal domain